MPRLLCERGRALIRLSSIGRQSLTLSSKETDTLVCLVLRSAVISRLFQVTGERLSACLLSTPPSRITARTRGGPGSKLIDFSVIVAILPVPRRGSLETNRRKKGRAAKVDGPFPLSITLF